MLCIALALGLLASGCSDLEPLPGPEPTGIAANPTGPAPTPTGVAPTVVPSASPSPSPTASPSPSLTPTITPTPTPTPLPGEQLQQALHEQFNGNYEVAVALYQDMLAGSLDEGQDPQVRAHLAECYQQMGDHSAAVAAWEDFLARYPGDARAPGATLAAARAYQDLGQCDRAVPLYETYLGYEPIMAGRVYDWIGACEVALGDLEGAIAAYRQGLASTGDRTEQANYREKLAEVYWALGRFEAALDEYDEILKTARVEAHRARMEYQAGLALVAAGEYDLGYARYQRAIDRYPTTAHAYLSLIELVEAGVEVDELQRGLVDYHAGANYPDAYGAAVLAFDRYLASKPETRVDEALYFKALSQRGLGQTEEALLTLDEVILEHPTSQWLAAAWMERAATLALMGENDPAVKVYQDVTAFFPADERAPRALWRAARLREDEGVYPEAALLYENVQASFPAHEDAAEALWRAGLLHYRHDAPDRATAAWQVLVDGYPGSAFRSRALYWLGKLASAGTTGDENRHWVELVSDDPHGYYALRVQQIRNDDSLTISRLDTAAVTPPASDEAQDEAEVLDWLKSWIEVPAGTSLTELSAVARENKHFGQGEAFLAAGLRQEALAAFDQLRSAFADDALALAQLALYFHERDLYAQASRCAYRAVVLWPDGQIHDAPLLIQRLTFPLAYADLLSAESEAYGLDPLLLAALIRQESLFEPTAESYAGARGLGQVMPATGQGIARNLAMEEFRLEDLYRPAVSIRFAANYLSIQLAYFDNQLLVALAAYNGGPGNTLRWLEAAGDDLDLFVEAITAAQSRLYLQKLYEQYHVYERLYRAP